MCDESLKNVKMDIQKINKILNQRDGKSNDVFFGLRRLVSYPYNLGYKLEDLENRFETQELTEEDVRQICAIIDMDYHILELTEKYGIHPITGSCIEQINVDRLEKMKDERIRQKANLKELIQECEVR